MKLLNRTLLGFLVYSVAVLLIVTPVLYLVINDIIISRVDETLQLHKKEIQARLEKFPSEADVQQWEDLDGEVVVKPLAGPPVAESIVTIEGYRVLSGSVEIKGKLYSIQAQVSLVESDDLIRVLVLTQVLVLIALITGVSTINWWNSKTVWKPFYNVLNQLKSFRIEKNHEIDLKPSSITEFNDLNSAVRELVHRDREAFISQREFTENAAHEMQTPLAVFQSKLDMLLQTRPSEEQAPLIESLLDTTQRLNRLNKGLLLLAKIENKQFVDTEEVDVYITTQRLVQDTGIMIAGAKLVVKINPLLFDILVSNLVSNSVRYSSDQSRIAINIGNSTWTITNPGLPLSIDREKIFQRFLKGNTNKESVGLGLAIAKKICDTNDFGLSYSFLNNLHSFTIAFSKSQISPKSLR